MLVPVLTKRFRKRDLFLMLTMLEIALRVGFYTAGYDNLILVFGFLALIHAANVITNDDALNNIESTLNQELSNLQLANNAHHQSALAGMAELRAAITAAQQQIALLTVQVPPPAPTSPPTNYQRNNNYRGGRNNYRGRGGGRNNNIAAPAPPAAGGIPPAPAYVPNNGNRGAQLCHLVKHAAGVVRK